MTDNAIQKVDIGWLAEFQEQDKSLDKLAAHRVLTRAQILQSNSKNRDAVKAYGEGAVIAVPGSHLIAKPDGGSFLFVPLFFFEQFITWKDINDNGDDPAIIDKSLEESSAVAKKARDKDARKEAYGDGYFYKHKEHLTFPGIIYGPEGHPLQGQTITLEFSGGEFWNGEAFCTAIAGRRANGRRVPSWAQVWEIRTAEHKNKNDQRWMGYEVSAPDPEVGLTIAPTDAAAFKVLHEELARQYKESALEVDYSDADAAEETEVESANLDD